MNDAGAWSSTAIYGITILDEGTVIENGSAEGIVVTYSYMALRCLPISPGFFSVITNGIGSSASYDNNRVEYGKVFPKEAAADSDAKAKLLSAGTALLSSMGSGFKSLPNTVVKSLDTIAALSSLPASASVSSSNASVPNIIPNPTPVASVASALGPSNNLPSLPMATTATQIITSYRAMVRGASYVKQYANYNPFSTGVTH